MKIQTAELIDCKDSLAEALLAETTYPWEALSKIGDYIRSLFPKLGDDFEEVAPEVYVHRDATVYPSAFIKGPAIIDAGTEVRHCAFIRGNALIGKDCVVGNSTEIKNSILVGNVEVPHYNYVGDSILGRFSHMGAGSITSNVKADRKNVHFLMQGEWRDTGLRKFGAILGDHVEVGCNAVLNPGTVIGRNSRVYPLSMVRGFVPEDSIYKKAAEIVRLEPRD